MGNEPAVANVTLAQVNTFMGAIPTVAGGFAIQLPGAAGPSFNAGAGIFPFGGFGRLGDLLQVPYVSSYLITTVAAAPNIVEVNALPMDFSLADDQDAADDANENVGRFCAGPQFVGTVTHPGGRYDSGQFPDEPECECL